MEDWVTKTTRRRGCIATVVHEVEKLNETDRCYQSR